jgi:hypothetical protein
VSKRFLAFLGNPPNPASEVFANLLPHGRGSVAEPRASASGHSKVVMTLCLVPSASKIKSLRSGLMVQFGEADECEGLLIGLGDKLVLRGVPRQHSSDGMDVPLAGFDE